MSTVPVSYESFAEYTPYSTVGPYRAEDYLKLPEGERVELLRGRFIASPCPTPLHQLVAMELAYRLQRIADATGDIVLMAPMDVVLSDHTILQPDVLLVRAVSRGRVRDRVYGPADLAIEVLSPSTSRRDRIEKLALYAQHGVAEFWIVDPDARVIEFLILRDGAYQVSVTGDGKYRSTQFAEVEIDVADFWSVIERRSI